jgi:hypothetical protein
MKTIKRSSAHRPTNGAAPKINNSTIDLPLGEEKKFFGLSSRSLNMVMIIVISLVFWSTYSYIFDSKHDLNGDNLVYYSLGQAIHQGKGYVNIMSFNETPHTHFPPGYPFFISVLMNVTDSAAAIKFVDGIMFFFSVLLLFSIFKKISGQVWISFVSCLIISGHPEIHRFATMMMSEMLYLFLTMLMTWIVLGVEPSTAFSEKNKKKNIIKLVVFAVCFGYIYLVRTMGASFLLSVLLVLAGQSVWYLFKGLKAKAENPLWWKNGLLSALLFLVVGIASLGIYKSAWDARNASVGVTKSEYMGDFQGKAGGGKMETTADWTTRIKKNFELYITSWIPKAVISPETEVDIDASPTSSAWLGGILLFGVILLGALTLKDKYLFILYMGITFAVLMVWQEQYSGLRYFLTVIPLVIFSFVYGLWRVIRFIYQRFFKKQPAQVWQYALCIILPLLVVSHYSKGAQAQHEVAKYKDWKDAVNVIGPAGAEYIAACEWIGKNLPKDAVVACRKPEIFYMYSGYHKAQGILRDGKPEEILGYLIKNKVEYIIIDHWYRHAIATIIPLATTYYPQMFKPILGIGGNYQGMPPTYILKFDPNAKAVDQTSQAENQNGGVKAAN